LQLTSRPIYRTTVCTLAGRFEQFDERLLTEAVIALPNWVAFDEHESHTGKLIHAFEHFARWAFQAPDSEEPPDKAALQELLFEIGELGATEKHLRRRLISLNRASPGGALRRILDLAAEVNPSPDFERVLDDAADPIFRQARLAQHEQRTKLSRSIYGSHERDLRALEPDAVSAAAEQIGSDLDLVTHELQIRVLGGRSREALLRRYATRCENFDAMELRELAAAHPGRVERKLTDDFAKYLFDQGMTPLLEHSIAGLRADLTHPDVSSLLYVEAKQYSDGDARRTVLNAYRQVWTTWGRLRNSFRVPEAFLLVFRLSGPRAELPRVLRHRGLSLHTVLVDIADRSGSREKETPISFEDAELLPRPAESEKVEA
jgi:hypothetical protein